MTAIMFDSAWDRAKRWMLRGGLTFGAGLALWVSSMLGSTLFGPVIEAARPGATLLTQKVIDTFGGRWVVGTIALLLLLFSQWLRGRRLQLRQKDYDSTGQKILTTLRSDPAARVPDFYLYLRAFETTGKLHVPLYLRVRRKCVWVGQRQVTDDLESYVTLAVGGRAPLIALGKPGEAIGAGRILTEEEHWQADIVNLMRRAKGILIVPSDREGTVWEMDTLKREELFSKVVFIMPPTSKGEFDTFRRWEAAKCAMAVNGLEAPEHQDRGLLFRLGPDGKLVNAEPLMLSSPRKIHKSLDRIFKTKQGKSIYKAIVNADKRASHGAFWGWLENARQLSVFPVALLAILMPTSNVGFDPQESWGTVFQRFITASEMSEYDQSEELNKSQKYLALRAHVAPENLDQLNQALLARGLSSLDDANLRVYYVAQAEMMSRLGDARCSALVSSGRMQIAFTYMPSDEYRDFAKARDRAIVAGAENTPIVTMDTSEENNITQRFAASLSQQDQQRFEQFGQKKTHTADDQCWLLRTVSNAVASLPEPQGTLWARTWTAMSTGNPDPNPRPVPQPEPIEPEPVKHYPVEPSPAPPQRYDPQKDALLKQKLADREAKTSQASAIQTNAAATQTLPPDPSVAMIERARLDLDSGRLIEPASDCALYWARQLTQGGNPQGAEIEHNVLSAMGKRISDARASKNYISAIDDLNKLIPYYPARIELVSLRSQIQAEEQREVAEAQLKKFVLEHRHIVFANNGAMQQAYCVGVLVLSGDGTARFDCVNSFDPQGRCDHVVFPAGAIKNVKFMANGLLHVATHHAGNYDFYGESAALQGAYQELGLMATR